MVVISSSPPPNVRGKLRSTTRSSLVHKFTSQVNILPFSGVASFRALPFDLGRFARPLCCFDIREPRVVSDVLNQKPLTRVDNQE